jgi:hypothetical protein
MNGDFEFAALLLGRQATVAEVAQLRAAFEQASEVEVSLGEGIYLMSTASGMLLTPSWLSCNVRQWGISRTRWMDGKRG